MAQYTNRIKLPYTIYKRSKEDELKAWLDTPLSDYALGQLRKKYPEKLEEALESLNSDRMFCSNMPKEALRGKEYRKFLEDCLQDLKGCTAAKIKFYLGGYAVASLTFDHELSEDEENVLDEAMDGQMSDGYGENEFRLFEADGYSYILRF